MTRPTLPDPIPLRDILANLFEAVPTGAASVINEGNTK